MSQYLMFCDAVHGLLDELQHMQCGCTLAERNSGHRVDCNWPKVREEAARVREFLREPA